MTASRAIELAKAAIRRGLLSEGTEALSLDVIEDCDELLRRIFRELEIAFRLSAAPGDDKDKQLRAAARKHAEASHANAIANLYKKGGHHA